MRIAYSKVGRSWNLDPTNGTATGGDADVARALHLLARSRPQDEFILVGKNSSEDPQDVGYPSNVINPWHGYKVPAGTADESRLVTAERIYEATKHMFVDIDAHIVWAGQHGTSNYPIPMVDDRSTLTSPQISFVNYASFIIRQINEWRDQDPNREEIWLCPDPRNYLKARDLKWPNRHSVIAQFNEVREAKNERYGDMTDPSEWGARWDPVSNRGVWISPAKYTYDALELTAIPGPSNVTQLIPWEARQPFGILVNENRAYVKRGRLAIIREWVLEFWPDAEIFGVWTDASKKELNRPDIHPVNYSEVCATMNRWKCTLTTPASGTGWATAKPWEAFKFGTVCFFHPEYDTQDHILKDAPRELHDWLRVKTAEDFKKRVEMLDNDRGAWEWIIKAQFDYYVQKYDEHKGGIAAIERRLS